MKTFVAGVLAALSLVAVVVGAFYFGRRSIGPGPAVSPTPQAIPRPATPEATGPVFPSPPIVPEPPTLPTLTPTLTPTPAAMPTTDDTAAIKQALIDKTGIPEDNLQFAVNQNTGTHAKGLVKEKDAVGGGYWIAAKAYNQWVIVYDGQATPTCEQIAPYNFPTDMVPECLGTDGTLVTR